MKKLSLKVPDVLYDKISRTANKKDTTKSEIIRQALNMYFSKRSYSGRALSFYDLTKKYCGYIKNAPHDLSYNEEHLEGYGE